MILLPLHGSRWTRKPDPGTALDLGHPLCPDHCWPFLSPQQWAEDIGKRRGVISTPNNGSGSGLYTGSGSIVPGRKYGLSARHGATSDRIDLTPNTDSAQAGSVIPYDASTNISGFTVLICSRKTDSTNRASQIFGNNIDASSGIQRCCLNAPYSDGNVYWQYAGFGATTQLAVSGLSFGDDLWVGAAGLSGMGLWQNGVKVGTIATANPGRTFANSLDWISLGNCSIRSFTADLCDTALVMTWNRQLTDSQIRSLSVNPWQVFQPPTVLVYGNFASSNVTVALTGVSATTSVGSVGVAGVSSALTGVSSTGSVGSVGPQTAVQITGVRATGTPGTVSAGGVTVPITGVSAAGHPGTVGPQTTVGVTGVGATGTPGTVTVALDGNIRVTQAPELTAIQGSSTIRVTQTPVETAIQGAGQIRVTQTPILYLRQFLGTCTPKPPKDTVLRVTTIELTPRWSLERYDIEPRLEGRMKGGNPGVPAPIPGGSQQWMLSRFDIAQDEEETS